MYNKSLILIFVSIYLCSAIDPYQIEQCEEKHCQHEFSECHNDVSCSYVTHCHKSCNNEDECLKCSNEFMSNQLFWEYQLCSLSCIKTIGYKNELSRQKISLCEKSICKPYLKECADDMNCNIGLNCIIECEKSKNHSCQAKCLIENLYKSDLLGNIHICNSDCLISLIN